MADDEIGVLTHSKTEVPDQLASPEEQTSQAHAEPGFEHQRPPPFSARDAYSRRMSQCFEERAEYRRWMRRIRAGVAPKP